MDEISLIVSRSCQTNPQEYFLIEEKLNPISEVSEIGRPKTNLDATSSKTTVKKNTKVKYKKTSWLWSNQQKKHPKLVEGFKFTNHDIDQNKFFKENHPKSCKMFKLKTFLDLEVFLPIAF